MDEVNKLSGKEILRINKYLASCGLASRRNCEQLVTEGRVTVNNKKITSLSTDINEETDFVQVDGARVQPIHKHIYVMLNKPKGYVCTTSDELERKTVMELLSGKYKDKRIFPIGRLDYDTEGLLLLTTDGDLSNRLMHPSHEVSKTYVARIEGEVTESELNKIRAGVILDGVKTNKCKAKLLEFTDKQGKAESRIEVTISQGRNRQVRRMFESINREVIFLKRTAIGELKLGGLYRGEFRELKDFEIDYLKNI